MDANQLAELKIQIQELLDKGDIRPSTSPLGAPVILFQRKMEVHECVYTINNKYHLPRIDDLFD